jgi:hypothetical protein
MTMAQGDYLPGTYSRVGTEENPGTYLGGDSGGMGTYQRSLGQLRQMDERRILENGTAHFLYRQYLA